MVNSKKKRVLCVIGTRPEVIKMAPVISHLRQKQEIDLRVLTTAQHRQMLDQMLNLFGIVPDVDLNLMKVNQSLPHLTATLPIPLDESFEKEKPDLVFAQGDTTTAFMVSLACYYRHIPFGHVEAGLRTGTLYNPFPEEMNRVLISRLSTLNFSPTERAKQNLLREGNFEGSIFVTGNTVIDALYEILKREIKLDDRIQGDKRLILVTAHRRENFGENLIQICNAIRTLAEKNPDIQFLYPVHPNPNVCETVYRLLGDLPRIILSDPLPYEMFVKAMKESYLILSDSGGVQEEAPSLQTPVLILRETTERPEAVEIGAAKLIGTCSETIVEITQNLLDHPQEYEKMIVSKSPFGDGKAAIRIGEITRSFLYS